MPNRLADAIAELREEIDREWREADKAAAKVDEHKGRADRLRAAATKAFRDGDEAAGIAATREAAKQTELALDQSNKGCHILTEIQGKYTALDIMHNIFMRNDRRSR